MAIDSERNAVGQALVLLAACLLLVIAISPLQLAFPRTGLALTQLGAILLPAFLFLGRKHPDLRNALRWRPIPIVDGALALGIGLTGWGVAVLLLELVSFALGPAPAAEGLQPTSAADWLTVVAVAAALPALCEETLFRGCLQGVLERRGPVPGVSTHRDALRRLHLVPHTMLPAAFLGIVLGTLVVRSGSIPIAAGTLLGLGSPPASSRASCSRPRRPTRPRSRRWPWRWSPSAAPPRSSPPCAPRGWTRSRRCAPSRRRRADAGEPRGTTGGTRDGTVPDTAAVAPGAVRPPAGLGGPVTRGLEHACSDLFVELAEVGSQGLVLKRPARRSQASR